MPLYNEVVWAKIGAYRWWPALVVPPEKLPNKIEMLPHQVILHIFSRNKLFADFLFLFNGELFKSSTSKLDSLRSCEVID